MNFRLATVFLTLFLLSCSTEVILDGTSRESFRASIKKMKAPMSAEERERLDLYIVGIGIVKKSEDPAEEEEKQVGIEYQMQALHGKNLEGINALAEEVSQKFIRLTGAPAIPKITNREFKKIDWAAIRKEVEGLKQSEPVTDNRSYNQVELTLSEPQNRSWHVNQKFFEAAKHRSFRHMDRFLEEGAYINATNNSEQSPAIAMSFINNDRNNRTLIYLLDNGANPNSQDRYGRTPLQHAITSRNHVAVQILLDAGVKLNDQHNGHTAITLAASRRDGALVDGLMQYGADINATDSAGKTALIYMIQHGFNEVAKRLIEEGAVIEKSGIHALDFAREINNAEMVQLLEDMI